MKFPREHRFVLAAQLQQTALEFHDALFETLLTGSPKAQLKRADNLLRRIKTYWRLAFDLQLMPVKRYEHGARLLDEVGRLLGGWMKTL